jgi:hypothetical protein
MSTGMAEPAADLGVLLNAIDAKALAQGVDGLMAPERVLYHVSCIFFEVDLGTFDGYYYNSAGGYAAEAAEALQTIGAQRTSAIVRRANALFPNGTPARDRDLRFEQLAALRSATSSALDELSSEFYHRTGEDIDALMETYAAGHGLLLLPSR